jgi:hypothetical protein
LVVGRCGVGGASKFGLNRLGYEPYSDEEMEEFTRVFDHLAARFGGRFTKPWG